MEFRSCARGVSGVAQFNATDEQLSKTEAALFSCRLFFLSAFLFIRLIIYVICPSMPGNKMFNKVLHVLDCYCDTVKMWTVHTHVQLYLLFRTHTNTSEKRRDALAFYKKISRGMSNGLAYMHDQGYVHRNLTLTSVVVSDKL